MAFKPDIDDLRESPALEITKKLAEQGLNVFAIEPNIHSLPSGLRQNVELIDFDNRSQADIHLILVAHHKFKTMTITSEYILNTVGI